MFFLLFSAPELNILEVYYTGSFNFSLITTLISRGEVWCHILASLSDSIQALIQHFFHQPSWAKCCIFLQLPGNIYKCLKQYIFNKNKTNHIKSLLKKKTIILWIYQASHCQWDDQYDFLKPGCFAFTLTLHISYLWESSDYVMATINQRVNDWK